MVYIEFTEIISYFYRGIDFTLFTTRLNNRLFYITKEPLNFAGYFSGEA